MIVIAGTEVHATYWSTVAQVIPILTVALIFEARRTSSRWTLESRALRIVDSVLYMTVAIILVATFFLALGQLTSERAVPQVVVVSTNYLLGYVVAFVTLSPLITMALRGNIDVFVIVWGWFPWSKWRKTRRSLKRANRELQKSIAELNGHVSQLMSDSQRLSDLQTRIKALKKSSPRLQRAIDDGDRAVMKAELDTDDPALAQQSLDEITDIIEKYTQLKKKNREMLHTSEGMLATARIHYAEAEALLKKSHMSALDPETVSELKRIIETASSQMDIADQNSKSTRAATASTEAAIQTLEASVSERGAP